VNAVASRSVARVRIRAGAIDAEEATITVDADVYDGLHSVIGKRRISRFLSDLARPHVVGKGPRTRYAAIAADEARERGAAAWAEGLIADVADEPRRHG
jgi:hypothetical protein